ncbi:MAG: endosialidase [Lachnospiraceae bacterium]|jgi:hypothetical protein|nr:endosialidase [Lachnospiraceae bacterium]
MAVVKDLIKVESDGSLSFGDYTLQEKGKLEDFKYNGDVYSVKTYKPMTKFKRNDMLVYESVPGTSVNNLVEDEEKLEFLVSGEGDAQITVGLEENTEYDVNIAGKDLGKMPTNMSGKLSLSIDLQGKGEVKVVIKK